MQCLLYWFGVWLDAQRVFRDLTRYSWHVGWAPGKDFLLFVEESDEGSRLLFREVGVEADCLCWVRRVHLVGDRVAVDPEVSPVLFLLASAC